MPSFRFKQYQVIGRAIPTEKDPQPKIFRMKLWSTNAVRARSKFWYFVSFFKKVKRVHGQILSCNEIHEKDPTTVKNFGIWLRYRSRSGQHNMYKEYRNTTMNGAIESMYNEMASRHRARSKDIMIIKTAVIPDDHVKRANNLQFLQEDLQFPLISTYIRAPSKKMKTIYKAQRPNLCK